MLEVLEETLSHSGQLEDSNCSTVLDLLCCFIDLFYHDGSNVFGWREVQITSAPGVCYNKTLQL